MTNTQNVKSEFFQALHGNSPLTVPLTFFRAAVERHGGAIIAPEDNKQPGSIPPIASIHLHNVVGIGATVEAAARNWIDQQVQLFAAIDSTAGHA